MYRYGISTTKAQSNHNKYVEDQTPISVLYLSYLSLDEGVIGLRVLSRSLWVSGRVIVVWHHPLTGKGEWGEGRGDGATVSPI